MEKTTVDSQQMENFSRLSNEWWNNWGMFRPLHAMNKLRIPLIQKRLIAVEKIGPIVNKKAPLEGLTILDVGCGGGILTEPLSRLGCTVTGLDPNTDLINLAKERAEEQNLYNLTYVCSTVEKHAIDFKEKYDVVTCFETIEHVAEQEIFVKYCVQCLKPGGSIFFSTNSKSTVSKFISITLMETLLRIIPRGSHKYEMFIDIDVLIDLLKEEGCETSFTSGMMYNPLTNDWFLIRNKSLLFYIMHAVKSI